MKCDGRFCLCRTGAEYNVCHIPKQKKNARGAGRTNWAGDGKSHTQNDRQERRQKEKECNHTDTSIHLPNPPSIEKSGSQHIHLPSNHPQRVKDERRGLYSTPRSVHVPPRITHQSTCRRGRASPLTPWHPLTPVSASCRDIFNSDGIKHRARPPLLT